MDALAELLEKIKDEGLAKGNLVGFLHVLIGRRISGVNDTPVSQGLSWRELSSWLQRMRWDASAISELSLTSKDLPPKDRQRFWFAAIARAAVDSPSAVKAGDLFAKKLQGLGYAVGPAPAESTPVTPDAKPVASKGSRRRGKKN